MKTKIIKINNKRGSKCGCLCISFEDMTGKTFETEKPLKKAA